MYKLEDLKFDEKFDTLIVQDTNTKVLMLAYMNEDSLKNFGDRGGFGPSRENLAQGNISTFKR